MYVTLKCDGVDLVLILKSAWKVANTTSSIFGQLSLWTLAWFEDLFLLSAFRRSMNRFVANKASTIHTGGNNAHIRQFSSWIHLVLAWLS